MPQYKTITELKANARNILRGNSGNAILVPFLNGLISFSVAFILIMMLSAGMTFVALFAGYSLSFVESAGYSLAIYVFVLFLSCFAGILSPGMIYFFLNTACGKRARVSDLFYGFRYCFGKALAISATLVVITQLCTLPAQLVEYMVPNELLADILYWYLYIGGMMLNTFLSLGLSQTYYLMLDFPQYGAIDLLKLSWQVTNGHKCRLLCIRLSFFPLILLSILTLGIGMLWVTPYMQMTLTLFFLDLMNPQKAPPRLFFSD